MRIASRAQPKCEEYISGMYKSRYTQIMQPSVPVIKIENVKLSLAGQWIQRGINLHVQRGEIIAIVGGSGSGNRRCCAKF